MSESLIQMLVTGLVGALLAMELVARDHVLGRGRRSRTVEPPSAILIRRSFAIRDHLRAGRARLGPLRAGTARPSSRPVTVDGSATRSGASSRRRLNATLAAAAWIAGAPGCAGWRTVPAAPDGSWSRPTPRPPDVQSANGVSRRRDPDLRVSVVDRAWLSGRLSRPMSTVTPLSGPIVPDDGSAATG